MSLESVDLRRSKRVVEHYISGFDCAKDARIFGSYVFRKVENIIGKAKYHQSVATTDSFVAITKDWIGPTILKSTYLEIYQDEAILIRETMKAALKTFPKLKLEKEVVREKPQAQFINLEYIPKTTTMGRL